MYSNVGSYVPNYGVLTIEKVYTPIVGILNLQNVKK
jgi:hypothetical protein